MVFKLCAGRLPQSDHELSSQPTMSRLENSIDSKDLYRIGKQLVDNFIGSYAREPEVIILDCDDTNNNTYGQQELNLFNHYYHNHCYMPLHIYEGLSGKLIATILKPGRRSKQSDIASHSLKDSLLVEVISLIDDCIKQDSSFVSYYINKANAFYNLNDFNSAISSLEDGFIYTRQPSLLFTIGILYEKEGDNTKANNYFTNALTLYDSLLSTVNFSPGDEVSREYVKVMLYGKQKTITDLKNR